MLHPNDFFSHPADKAAVQASRSEQEEYYLTKERCEFKGVHMVSRVTDKVRGAFGRYVFAITGKTAEELAAFNPDDEIALACEVNGADPAWPTSHKGSFRGRGNINIANRRLKTLSDVDSYLDGLVKNGARQY